MTDAAPLRDRVAFVLLVPSLAVPIVAIAIAAWRMGHLDDARLEHHPGIGLYYFAAMMTLSAALFSMAINAVLAVRNHASVSARAIPLRRVLPHFVVTLVITVWAVEFSLLQMAIEGLAFGIILVVGSLFSFAVVSGHRVVQRRFEAVELGALARPVFIGHPLAVAIVLAVSVAGFVAQSEIQIVGVAILGFLGLPWSGMTVMLWLPISAFTYMSGAGGAAMPLIFLLLAAGPAVANAALAIIFLRSNERRADFINDFLEIRSYAEPDSNTLTP